ncbi:caspase-3-like [Ornithodoros turicata]|uniref:caspase-3-like n=1 Tax=Ornithodoros turicata TaxID=34597 RepID=UPI00313861A1
MSSKEKAISNVGTGCEYQHQQARFLPVKVDSTEADSESSLIPGIHFEDSWYKMDNLETGGTRGMAVIINTHEIPCMGIRSETEEEFMMISKAFGGILRFELKRYDNVSLEKMRRAFADLASVDHSQSDCFVCFVYSHGKDDVIVCSDGETVRAQDIFCAFTESACPSLAGKPKLFFFEVTHGGHENQAYPKPCSLHPDSSSVTTTHRTPADLFIFYNRTQGNDSRRDRCCGSLFIQTLCQVLERYYCTRNFEAMMQTVMLLLAGRNVSPLPVMYSTFTKNLRFLPQCSRNTKASSERQEQSVWRQAFEGYKGQQREAGTVSMETGSLTTGTKMSDHIISAAKGTVSTQYQLVLDIREVYLLYEPQCIVTSITVFLSVFFSG